MARDGAKRAPSRGNRVRFNENDEIDVPVEERQSDRPTKEEARDFLTSKLPSTFRINIDHDPTR